MNMKISFKIAESDIFSESSGFRNKSDLPFDFFIEKEEFDSYTEVPIVVYFLFMGITLLIISVSVANAVEKYQDRDIEHGEQYMREYSAEEIRESKTRIINSLDWQPPILDSRVPIFQISSGLFTRDSMRKKNFPTSSITHSTGDESAIKT